MLATAGAEDVAPRLDVVRVHEQHADFVYLSLQRLGVGDADVEDLLQEVFLVVHRRLHTFDGSSALRTWLFGICTRVAAGSRNKAYHRREESRGDLPTDTRASGATPEEAAAAGQDRARLAAILDTMDPEKRALFVMFELDEMSCEEIAELFGIPVGTVYSRLHAARKAFQGAVARFEARESSRGVARCRGGP
jgi:RNA polymerase sigma-70 factor (ECF subfamily)